MKGEIMEAATKKKRGRPAMFTEAFYQFYSDEERRTAQNIHYLGVAALHVLKLKREDKGELYNFFITEKGNFKHCGILEQVGRMYEAGLVDEDEGRDLIERSIKEYKEGASMKDLERGLRFIRLSLQDERR